MISGDTRWLFTYLAVDDKFILPTKELSLVLKKCEFLKIIVDKDRDYAYTVLCVEK